MSADDVLSFTLEQPSAQPNNCVKLKLLILIFGMVLLPVSYHSHFESSWVNFDYPVLQFTRSNCSANGSMCHYIKPYKLCMVTQLFRRLKIACPDIGMEHYFLAVITTCWLLSVLGLMLLKYVDFEIHPLDKLDFAFHAISAILVSVGGILYIISAQQISSLFHSKQLQELIGGLLTAEKTVAGICGICFGLMYAWIATHIFKKYIYPEALNFTRFF